MAKEPPEHLRLGKAAEDRATRYLESRGLTLQQRNYRCPHGEIDLILVDHDLQTVVFVEVRYRRNQAFGSPAESIDRQKQQKLLASAEHFRQRHHDLGARACRFDVISICGDLEQGPLQWLQNAF